MKKKASSLQKLDPVPVRFDQSEKTQLEELSKNTGINTSVLIRLALKYTLPRLLSGEISLKHFADAEKSKAAA